MLSLYRLDFWPAVFYMVCAGVVFNLASPGVSQVTNVATLYWFIQKLYHNNVGVPVIMTHHVVTTSIACTIYEITSFTVYVTGWNEHKQTTT